MERLEFCSHIVAILGAYADQISTYLVLPLGIAYESNVTASSLQRSGLWTFVDVSILTSSIVVITLLIHNSRFRGRRALLAFPISFGTMRLCAALNNFHLVLKALILPALVSAFQMPFIN